MDALAAIYAWLSEGYGLDGSVLGEQAVQRAIQHRSRVLGDIDASQYLRIWDKDPMERESLLKLVLIGETWFFREPSSFEALEAWCLQRAQDPRSHLPLRILVLPCATGEEAWSVAAVLKALGWSGSSVRIEAIDLHPEYVEMARRGRYSERRLRETKVDPRWLESLGAIEAGQLRVDEDLRAMVSFATGNAGDPELLAGCPPFDVIFCRNLLIYLHVEARKRLLTTLVSHLREEGLLFLGHAEYLPEAFGFSKESKTGAFAWRRSPLKAPKQKVFEPASKPLRPKSSQTRGPTKPIGPLGLPAGSKGDEILASQTLTPRELADQGALQKALEALEFSGLNHSLDASVHALAGVLLDALGRRDEAVAHFRRALFLDPGHVESLAHLALLLEHLGRNHEAARVRKRLMGRD